jgi:hypothetical protein
VRAGLEEALVMFRVWQSDRALLRCDFLLTKFAACLRARVIDVSDDKVRLLSDDSFSEVVLPLSAELDFEYADSRDFPEEVAVFKRGLVVFFPGPRKPDKVLFLEVIEPPA